jgi:hypothetical protein
VLLQPRTVKYYSNISWKLSGFWFVSKDSCKKKFVLIYLIYPSVSQIIVFSSIFHPNLSTTCSFCELLCETTICLFCY